jgi:hypothetical protein
LPQVVDLEVDVAITAAFDLAPAHRKRVALSEDDQGV